MSGGLLPTARNLFGLGVKCVTPRLGLPKKVDHLGISTIPERQTGGWCSFFWACTRVGKAVSGKNGVWGLLAFRAGGGVCFDARTLSATADKNQHGKICPFLPLSRFGLHRNAKRKSSTMVSMQWSVDTPPNEDESEGLRHNDQSWGVFKALF